MFAYADKSTQEQKQEKPVAAAVHSTLRKPAYYFQDRRPQAIVQKKQVRAGKQFNYGNIALQTVADKSAYYFKDNRPQAVVQQKQVNALAKKQSNEKWIQKKTNNSNLIIQRYIKMPLHGQDDELVYNKRVAAADGKGFASTNNRGWIEIQKLQAAAQKIYRESEYEVEHTETKLIKAAKDEGVDPKNAPDDASKPRVTSLYTEREPCGDCHIFLSHELNARTPVFFSIPNNDNAFMALMMRQDMRHRIDKGKQQLAAQYNKALVGCSSENRKKLLSAFRDKFLPALSNIKEGLTGDNFNTRTANINQLIEQAMQEFKEIAGVASSSSSNSIMSPGSMGPQTASAASSGNVMQQPAPYLPQANSSSGSSSGNNFKSFMDPQQK